VQIVYSFEAYDPLAHVNHFLLSIIKTKRLYEKFITGGV